METRIALIGIIVEDIASAESINKILSENRQYIIGRMGLPYPEKGRFDYQYYHGCAQ